MGGRFGSAALVAALLLAGVTLAWTAAPGEAETVRFHGDAEGLEEAILDATRGVLREDVEAIASALDRVAAASPRVFDTETEAFSKQIKTMDRGFQLTLDAAREFSKKGNLARSIEQYRWVFHGCGNCHAAAREEGLIPPGPLGDSSPAGSAVPVSRIPEVPTDRPGGDLGDHR